MVRAGDVSPSRSACSIIFRAMRSFRLPVGFCPSSLAKMRASALGLIRCNSTMGVLPMVAKIPLYVSFVTMSCCLYLTRGWGTVL